MWLLDVVGFMVPVQDIAQQNGEKAAEKCDGNASGHLSRQDGVLQRSVAQPDHGGRKAGEQREGRGTGGGNQQGIPGVGGERKQFHGGIAPLQRILGSF